MAYLVAAHQYHLGARALLQQGRQAAHEHVVAAVGLEVAVDKRHHLVALCHQGRGQVLELPRKVLVHQ